MDPDKIEGLWKNSCSFCLYFPWMMCKLIKRVLMFEIHLLLGRKQLAYYVMHVGVNFFEKYSYFLHS